MIRLDESSIQDATCSDEGQHSRCPLGESLHRAVGPPLVRGRAVVTADEREGPLARVPSLRANHTDWPAPLRCVARRWAVWIGSAPTLADVIVGKVTELKPIPQKGEWYVLRGY